MPEPQLESRVEVFPALLPDQGQDRAGSPERPVEPEADRLRAPDERRPAVLRRPPPVRFAAIDVGSNSIHLVVAEISPQGDFRVVGRDKEMVQIGKGGFARHMLTARAMEAGLATLKRYVKMAQALEATRIKAVATSAVREARNGGDLVHRAREEMGLELQVISAEQEARLIYLGVRHEIDLGCGDNLIVDIGGGSAELIVGNEARPEFLGSLKLGGSRLAELFLASDPPDADEIKRLRKHVEEQLAPIAAQIGRRSFAAGIATSGTVQNIAAVCAHGSGDDTQESPRQLSVRRDVLKSLLEKVTSLSRAERLRIPELDPRRVDAVIPATILLLAVMRTFELDVLRHCDSALREGIILDHIARHRATLLARATWPDPRTRSMLHLAERCGYRKLHAEQVARLALSFYDQLAPLHRLPDRYRELLRDACLLHDIGYHIGHENHHKHSYYLIRNGELQGFETAEIEVIANIARYHRKGRPRKSHYSYGNLARADRKPVRRLVALLRIADALDRTHTSAVRAINVRLLKGRVQVRIQADHDAELELWTARRAAGFFEREYGMPLELLIEPEGGQG